MTTSAMGDRGAQSSGGLGDTWRRFVADSAPSTRDALRALPAEIGLPLGDDGAAWERFIQLEPNRALPSFAVPRSLRGRVCVDDELAFVRAHHHAAFFGVVADRIADRQVAPSAALREARAALLRAWERALGDALGDRRAARAHVAEDLRAWRVGLRLERAAFAARSLSPDRYFTAVSVRLRWVSTTARAMLRARGAHDASEALTEIIDRFLFACQCRDDAIDADDDRRVWGVSVPELLGLSQGSLLRAAVSSLRQAEQKARAAGFEALAIWLCAHTSEADVWWDGEPPLMQSMGAMVLTEATCR